MCQVEPLVVAQRQAGDRATIGTIWYSAASNFDSVQRHVFCHKPLPDSVTVNFIHGYRKFSDE